MKKLLLLFMLVVVTITMSAQSILKPVPGDLFKASSTMSIVPFMSAQPAVQIPVPGKWLLRLNTGVVGISYEIKKGSVPVPFSAIGFGLGYYYYENINGEPFNLWGVNALLLTNTQNAGLGLGLYGVYNTNAVGLLNLGAHYDFSVNKAFIDTGLTFKF